MSPALLPPSRRALLLIGAAAFWTPAQAQEAEDAQNAAAVADAEPTLTLETLSVTAAPGTTTEGTGSWTTEWMRSATGLTLPQRETPQSTSVVTHQQMRDRQLNSIRDVMETAAGVTVQAYETNRVNYYSRGFLIDNYQYDGVPTTLNSTWNFGDGNMDMAAYDHVEIVRGAAGLTQGVGEPGGSVNFIRKRPTAERQLYSAATFGADQFVRGDIDFGGPINGSGRLRGRVVGAAQTREASIDLYEEDLNVLYGVIEADVGDATIVSFGAHRQETDPTGVTWGGLPTWTSDLEEIDWPDGATTAAEWTQYPTTMTEVFGAVEHIFGNGWTSRVAVNYLENDFDAKLLWLYGLPDAETGLGMGASPARYKGDRDQLSGTATLNGQFEAWGREQEFVVGLYASDQKVRTHGIGYDPATLDEVGSIWDWDGSFSEPSWTGPDGYIDNSDTTQAAIYGAVRLRPTDALAVIAGLRANWWDGAERSATQTYDYEYKGKLTPYLGATYSLTRNVDAYASVTSIYQPQLVQDVNEAYLDPTYGWNYEAGFKASFFEDRLYAAAAVFRTEQKDYANYLYYIEEEQRSVYEQIDGTTTDGFEIETAGAITDRWQVSGSFTYRESEDDQGRQLQRDQPRATVKFFTAYNMPKYFDDRLTVGGGFRWQSTTYNMDWEGEMPDVKQDPYAVFDAMARYDITEDVALKVNVTNLFDEKYYQTMGFYDSVVYGPGRGAQVLLSATF